MAEVAKDPRAGVAKRLDKALDRWGNGIMAFEERLKDFIGKDEKAGRSYPAIKRYLSGEVTPSLEFLSVAAEVLGVRYPWLATGQGEPTEEQESARRVREETAAAGEPMDATSRALQAALAEVSVFDGPENPGLRGQLHQFLGELVTSRGMTEIDAPLSGSEAGLVVNAIRSLISTPWGTFRAWTESDRSGWDYWAYATAMLHTLTLALPEPGAVPPRHLCARVVLMARGGSAGEPVSKEMLPDHVPEAEREDVERWLNEALESLEEEN